MQKIDHTIKSGFIRFSLNGWVMTDENNRVYGVPGNLPLHTPEDLEGTIVSCLVGVEFEPFKTFPKTTVYVYSQITNQEV